MVLLSLLALTFLTRSENPGWLRFDRIPSWIPVIKTSIRQRQQTTDRDIYGI